MRQLKRWKRLWRRSLTRSHKKTFMGPCRSCWNSTTSARRLLGRGLEFHVCTINKIAHTKKSRNLFNDPRTSMYRIKLILTHIKFTQCSWKNKSVRMNKCTFMYTCVFKWGERERERERICVFFCLFVGWFKFYGLSTFLGYLKPNPFFTQINSSISNNSV